MNPRMRGRLFDATLTFFHSPLLLYPFSTLWYGLALFRFGTMGLVFAGVPFAVFFGFIACVFCFQSEHGDWNGQIGFLELVFVFLALTLGMIPGVNLTPAWLVASRRRRRHLKRLAARKLAAQRQKKLKPRAGRLDDSVVPPLGDVSVKDVKVNRRRTRK